MAASRLQLLAGLVLLGLVPVLAFILDRSAYLVVLSLVSVVVIAWSVYRMLSPSEHATAAVE